MKKEIVTSLLAIGLVVAAHAGGETDTPAIPVITKASAVLAPTKGNTAAGLVTFTKVEGGVRIVADLTGLSMGIAAHRTEPRRAGITIRTTAANMAHRTQPDGMRAILGIWTRTRPARRTMSAWTRLSPWRAWIPSSVMA